MYELLVQAGKDSPVIGNADGSYLTLKSNQGLIFGAATILSGTCWTTVCGNGHTKIDVYRVLVGVL